MLVPSPRRRFGYSISVFMVVAWWYGMSLVSRHNRHLGRWPGRPDHALGQNVVASATDENLLAGSATGVICLMCPSVYETSYVSVYGY